MSEITFADFFAGIGGFHLGLTRANYDGGIPAEYRSKIDNGGSDGRTAEPLFRCVWANEWDRHARSVYIRHFGECDRRDIRTVPFGEIPDFNVLCSGAPCTDFSIVGPRSGIGGERGNLLLTTLSIAEAKRPDVVFIENVPGLLSVDGGRTFAYTVGTLAEMGYCVQWICINCTTVGLPQSRERLFIIANSRGVPRPQILPLGGDGKEDEQPRPKQVGNIAETGHDSIWGRVYDVDGIAPGLKAEGGGLGAKTGLILCKKPDGSTAIRRLTPLEAERLQGFPDKFTEYGTEDGNEVEISDVQRYRMCGNAVPVQVVEFLGRKIKESFAIA